MGNVKETVEAVQGIVESVPVYEDMLQPATKELGKGLLTISKLINIALAPVSGLVWGYEKIAKYLETSMAEKLKDKPKENITTPDPSIAVPAIEALRYTGNIKELREMFSNLIATTMNKEAASMAHPSFVEIIKQISSEEAKIIQLLTSDSFPLVSVNCVYEDHSYMRVIHNFTDLADVCSKPEMIFSYLDNLSRLGLIRIENKTISDKEGYNKLLTHPFVKESIRYAEEMGQLEPKIIRSTLFVTPFGRQFINVCAS